MSDSQPAAELRHSLSLLRTEWWLFVGVLASPLLYGVWVVATGRAVQSLAPAFGAAVVTTVGATPVTGLDVFAAVAWLLAPAAVATWVLDRQLSNSYGNLVTAYRLDHPGVLPAASGVPMLLATAAAVAVGPRPSVVAVMAVAGVHLFVRTVAFGRRVYSFSPRPLFTAMTVVSAVALAAAWLVGAQDLPGRVGAAVANVGVPTVVETWLAAAGVAPATALGGLVAVPALLSGTYLAVQTAVARRVMARAPLSNPQKRAEQRYPIMPPVPDRARPGSPTADGSSPPADAASTAGAPESSDTGVGADAGDSRSETRVFTTDEPVPEGGETVATVGGDEPTDDEWIDDTAIFTPEGAGGSAEECDTCGESTPQESVTFCPNCGTRL